MAKGKAGAGAVPSPQGTQPIINTNEEKTGETKPVVPPEVKENKSNKVEVDVDVLQGLIKQVADLEKKTNQIEQTASQDQIRKIEAMRASGKLVKAVKIRRYNNKLVLGWRVIRDEVWLADGKLHEKQDIEVFLDDGTSAETSLLQFTRACLYETYEVIKESKTATGDLEFVIMLNGGKELTINTKYVN